MPPVGKRVRVGEPPATRARTRDANAKAKLLVDSWARVAECCRRVSERPESATARRACLESLRANMAAIDEFGTTENVQDRLYLSWADDAKRMYDQISDALE